MKATLLFGFWALSTLSLMAQSQRHTQLFNEDWKFAHGHAADVRQDFMSGTEYFNYLTKAHGIHNEGPYCEKFSDSLWQSIRLPHDWVTTLPFAPEASHSHGYKTVGYKYPENSVGWYRKTFFVPKEAEGQHLELQFDGIFRNSIVWVNGIYMGVEPSGYASQTYDISDYLNYGDKNIVCVRADASLEEGWFYEGAGIYRNVWLRQTHPLHLKTWGTFVYALFE
ncbi:MAG: beta-galactosidase, partial [Bacteroidales bacterium]|nr:beta-galactosidase [Bacteroidales bacterium]